MTARRARSNASRLDAILRDYRRRFAPGRRAARARYAAMPDLKSAIHNAALALREDGKMESHQWRVGRVVLRRFEAALQRRRARIAAAESFDELYELLWSARVPRVGRLTVFDAALRIGWHLGLEPKAVYVHAGAAEGARELGLPIQNGQVQRRDLPSALQRLAPDEVEDCLCIYKGRFTPPMSRTWPAACSPPERGGTAVLC